METPALIRRAILRGDRRPQVAGQSAASRRRGEGYEFAELRGYVEGDDPRRIDWAATARAGSLQSKVMLEEHALFLVSILDESRSMYLGRKRRSIDVARDALHLWNQVVQTGDRCVLVGENQCFEPRGARPEIAARACSAHVLGTLDLEKALRYADAISPPGSALLCITDGWSAIDDGILHRIASRYDPTMLHVRDPWYRGFPLRGFVPVRDAETGRTKRLLITSRDDERYRAAAAAREEQLRERYERMSWRFGILEDDPQAALREVFLGHTGHDRKSAVKPSRLRP